MYDPTFEGDLLENDDDVAYGMLGEGPADAMERRRADDRRDTIAQLMWVDYVQERQRRGLA
jgi:hypothetical protein